MTSNQRVAVGTLIGTAILVAIGIWVIAWVGADAALNPDPRRDLPLPTAYAFTVEDVEFPARDGARLAGWFVAAAPPAGEEPVQHPSPAIILVHAYGGTRDAMLPVADALTSAGFHALIFDQRGTGHSVGANVTFGTREPLDVLGALDYVLTRPDVDHDGVGVMGVGFGGSVAIMAAAEDDRIRAVAAEAPYASLDAGLQAAQADEVGLPWLLRPLATRILVARLGGPLDDGAPLAAAARLGGRPVLLIADEEEPANAGAQAIYAALSGPRDLWAASRMTLGTGRTEIDREYVARVLDFWRRVFDPVAAAR